MRDRLRALNRIGMGLMLEHDLEVLLGRILATAKALTWSDGGVLFLADHDAEPPELVVHRVAVDSLSEAEVTRLRVSIDDTSIVGHAARTKEPVVVRDAYHLPPDAEFVIDRSFDEHHDYRRRSMACIPMVDHRDRLVGLLLLVNRKTDPRALLTSLADVDRYVRPYSRGDVEVARSLAGQAAVAIENAQLHARVERTLESMVEAAVSAIDDRDPATAGHSLRVAEACTALARAVDATVDGPYRDVHFSARQMRELHYAALLHDIGKLVVPEEVLLKAKKLPPVLWERVAARFDLIRRTLELQSCQVPTGDGDLTAELAELETMRQAVYHANEPSVLDQEASRELSRIAERSYCAADGSEMPYLTAEELHYLQLRRGTLDARERALVEYHAEATYRFLRQIPWTEDLENVTSYAYGHHEKLDGSGYPRHLQAADMPLPMRIIGLCDMYDALTAADRPYKRALSHAEALALLQEEASAGRLDDELLRILSESVRTV